MEGPDERGGCACSGGFTATLPVIFGVFLTATLEGLL